MQEMNRNHEVRLQMLLNKQSHIEGAAGPEDISEYHLLQ